MWFGVFIFFWLFGFLLSMYVFGDAYTFVRISLCFLHSTTITLVFKIYIIFAFARRSQIEALKKFDFYLSFIPEAWFSLCLILQYT